MSTRVRVVAGILKNANGDILIADRRQSRSMQDHWEFPGGKLDKGESPEQALSRELAEELGIQIASVCHFQHIEHDYDDLQVAIDFYLVDAWQGAPRGMEGQQLRWVALSALDRAMLLPADSPVIEALQAAGSAPGGSTVSK